MGLLTWTNILASGLITGCVYALVAMGLNLQYGLMRILNVAHGEFLMVGAYLAYWAHAAIGANPFVSALGIFLVMTPAGFLLHLLVFRRLVNTTSSVEAFEARGLLASFGLMFMIQNAAYLIWGADLRGFQYFKSSVALGSLSFDANKLAACAGALALALGLIAILRTTLIGKAVRALMQSPKGAALVGIDARLVHPLVFGAGLGLAGVAGALISSVYTISPAFGGPYTVTALIVISLGGFGSVTGSLVGGLLLGVIESAGVELTSPSLKMVLSYGVFVTILIARPNGLFAR